MGRGNTEEEMTGLAIECMGLGGRERPEVQWLKEKYREFMRREGIVGKEEGDRCIYRKMYGEMPVKQQDILKIRYWRTGRHLPVNHRQCVAFGRALGLDGEDMRYLLQGYYDGCDEVHEQEPADMQSVYWKRRRSMHRLVEGYLRGISQSRLEQMNINRGALEHSMRHLYYTEALSYIGREPWERERYLKSHITSVNYDSELGRNMKLLGAIPRKTMIRHLIILGMPALSLEWMNRQLKAFGYLELQEQHTLRSGERLDWLLIRLLDRYEAFRKGHTIQECRIWLQKRCGLLDACFAAEGRNRLRFMYFKSLKE